MSRVTTLLLLSLAGLLATCGEEGLRRDPECYVRECRERGSCTYLPEKHTCFPQSDADCRQSATCQLFGNCTHRLYGCYVGSDADCAGSDWCRDFGACELHDGRCSSGPTDGATDLPTDACAGESCE